MQVDVEIKTTIVQRSKRKFINFSIYSRLNSEHFPQDFPLKTFGYVYVGIHIW